MAFVIVAALEAVNRDVREVVSLFAPPLSVIAEVCASRESRCSLSAENPRRCGDPAGRQPLCRHRSAARDGTARHPTGSHRAQAQTSVRQAATRRCRRVTALKLAAVTAGSRRGRRIGVRREQRLLASAVGTEPAARKAVKGGPRRDALLGNACAFIEDVIATPTDELLAHPG